MTPPRFVVAAIIVSLSTSAVADDVIAGHELDRPTNGLIIGGALALGFGLSLIPMREHRALWQHELFGETDDAVHAQLSPRAG